MRMIKRIEQLRALMKKEAIDAYLVTSPANLRYLTNFTGTAGLAFITLDKAFFVTDFRYTEQANEQVQAMTILATARRHYQRNPSTDEKGKSQCSWF